MGPRTLVRGNERIGNRQIARVLLQWGRALSCAEIAYRWLPLLQQSGRFNGAAHSRARKLKAAARRTAGSAASMGPRTLVRGNSARLRLRRSSLAQLQWGRALSCAEMPSPTPMNIPYALASMGPRTL